MTDPNHAYRVAIEAIREAGGKAGEGETPYRLLHKLAKAKGLRMHGSQSFIGKTFSLSKSKMNQLARGALLQYCDSGVLQIPDVFKYSDRKQYRHDGDEKANRNLWRDSNKASKDANKPEPVKYSFNTVKS